MKSVRDEIVAAVKAAGVVGAGGAGFPTHIKINATVDVVIANGAECEPLLRAHQHIMAAEAEKLLMGMKTVMVAVGARRGYIGLKRKYAQAVEALQQVMARMQEREIQLYFLPDIYPAGDEQVLVYEVTGRIVPEGGIPLHVGVVVANVETLVNIANAAQGVPVTHKYVTVGGAVQQPVTLKVPLGTSVQEMIALAGGATVHPYAVIDGGPMMGKLVQPENPITKTTGGILVLPAGHSIIVGKTSPWQHLANRAKAVCCNCVACTDVCPRNLLGHGLEPHRIMQALGHGAVDGSGILSKAFLCSECGACETFGCSMGLSPRLVNAHLKRELVKAGLKNPHHEKPQSVKTNREYRMIPTKRLTARLGISQYDVKAPLKMDEIEVKQVRLPLSQHIGAPAKPVVKVGDLVARGDLVAAIPEGAGVGANLHASITGKITGIEGFITIEKV